jgi:HEAT repeat protein
VLSLVVVAITALGRSEHVVTREARAPLPIERLEREPPAISAETNTQLVTISAALRDPALADERALGILDEVAADPRDAATDVLLAAAESPSVVVSMGSMRALLGRPCDRVGQLLVRGLSHEDWQRRAWAAKVLRENGCVAAAPALRSRLAVEGDARVRRQLRAALAALDGRGIG